MSLRALIEAAQCASAERLTAQGLPQDVAVALAASMTQGSVRAPAPRAALVPPRARVAAGRPPRPPPLAWRAVPGGGWVLAEPTAAGGLLRWAELDRAGQLTALLHWSQAPGTSGGEHRLTRAAVRAPGLRWAGLLPLQGTSSLWSPADAISIVPAGGGPPGAEQERPLAALPPQRYARLTHLPPVDRPAALPRGVGTVLLNLLAQLMTDQHREAVRYLGPYPTPALFEALCVSFVPAGNLAEARARFVHGAPAQAFAGEMREQPLPWTPRPYAAMVDTHDDLYMQWCGAAELSCVWLGETPFTRCAAQLPMPAGGRLWREQTPHGPRDVAGLVALGRPFKRYALVDPAAGTVSHAVDWDEGTQDATPRGTQQQPLDDALRMAAIHWAVVRSTPALASAVAELADGLSMGWAPVPRALTHVGGGSVTVNASLGAHVRALAAHPPQAADGPQTLALMLVSDLFGALAVDLARLGQTRLEAALTPDPAALVARGRACQQAAQEALAQLLPRVLAQLAQGRLLPS